MPRAAGQDGVVATAHLLTSDIPLSLSPSLPLSLVRSFVRSFVRACVRAFVRSCVRSFVRSLISSCSVFGSSNSTNKRTIFNQTSPSPPPPLSLVPHHPTTTLPFAGFEEVNRSWKMPRAAGQDGAVATAHLLTSDIPLSPPLSPSLSLSLSLSISRARALRLLTLPKNIKK